MAGSVYWVGTNGNVYQKGADGQVEDHGALISDSGSGFEAAKASGIGTRIADPSAPVQIPSRTAAGSGVTDTSASDLAYLDDQEGQLRGMLGSSDRSLTDGLTSLDDSFNTTKQRQAEARAGASAGFATKREDTTKDKMGAVGAVKTNARTLSDSVRRILGMASGVNSTAYKDAAPGAIARDASIKTTGVNDTFARNFRNIDSAENDTMHQFDLSDEDLGAQRKSKESELRGGILQQQQGIYGDLADIAGKRTMIKGGDYNAARAATAAPRAAISDRQAQLDSLFSQFRTPFSAKPVTATEANLDKYNVDKTNIATQGAGAGGAASGEVSPYLQALKKRFQTA
jgi:hypothetical protein